MPTYRHNCHFTDMDESIAEIMRLAEMNRLRAHEIIREADIERIWSSIGAEVHLVGSLRMGLMSKHRDIDMHIYTERLVPEESFRAMAELSKNPSVGSISCRNLSQTEEACIEWHATWLDRDGREWQIDMIHILKGSRYDGYFERMAERISAVVTPQTREAIIRLKHDTPDNEKIPGIEYYVAVLRDGVRSYEEFTAWRRTHPCNGIIEWIP